MILITKFLIQLFGGTMYYLNLDILLEPADIPEPFVERDPVVRLCLHTQLAASAWLTG